ncbi:MAG: MFS transporter [Motiliproteus sp.]
MKTEGALPYWRLSSFYLCYFSLLGALVPFWGLYLKDLGFTISEIGSLVAILMGTRIVAPNLWGWLADRSGRRLSIIRSGSLLTVLVFSTAFWAFSFWQVAFLTFAFTFFWNAVLPQFEVVTLQFLGPNRARYSLIRLWGSVGFIVTVVGLGALFDYVSIRWLIPVLWALMILIWLTTLLVTQPPATESKVASGEFLRVVRRPEVIAFFLISLIVQFGHGPYYTFYSIYMTEFGYDKIDIGLLWGLGVLAEVLVFVVMHRLLEWTGLRNMVIFGLAVCAVRWLLIGLFPDSLVIVLFAQSLHAVTFGCLHASGITLVQQFFPPGIQGQGQALYSSFGFGVGGALGAYFSGWIWTLAGGTATFIAAAAISLIGLVIAWLWLRTD